MAWLVKRMAVLATVASALLVAAKSLAAEGVLPADWLGAQVNERGQHCEPHGEQRDAARLLLACGPAGVWAIALSESGPRFVRSYEFSGDVVGFFTEADGRLWVKLQVLEARPFSSPAAPGSAGPVRFPDAAAVVPAPPSADPSELLPSPPPAATVAAPPGKKTGRVLRSEPGEVVISLGTADGVARGDRIELMLERVDGSDRDAALSRELIAIGVVSNVTEQSAKVRLGVNESAPVGALATPIKTQSTSSLTAPPRIGSIWTVEGVIRPFAALDELGAGMLLSVAIGRRFAGNFHVRAVLDPLAFADVQDKRSVNAVQASLLASYDSQYFEMGLGLGGQTVNDTDFLFVPGSGFSVAQLIRLGAQDGLNINARTSIVLFHSQFDFGGMVASMHIPVSRGYWLLLGGGGGAVGYGFGEFGLRAMLKGNGHAGSRFLTVTAGGAAVFSDGGCEELTPNVPFGPVAPCSPFISYGGPMAGIGYEWRF